MIYWSWKLPQGRTALVKHVYLLFLYLLLSLLLPPYILVNLFLIQSYRTYAIASTGYDPNIAYPIAHIDQTRGIDSLPFRNPLTDETVMVGAGKRANS